MGICFKCQKGDCMKRRIISIILAMCMMTDFVSINLAANAQYLYTNGENTKVMLSDNFTTVEVSIQDTITGENLTGAELQVIDEDGNTCEHWLSNNSPHIMEDILIAGETYTLREITAPDGYILAEDMQFIVPEDGLLAEIVMKNQSIDVEIESNEYQKVIDFVAYDDNNAAITEDGSLYIWGTDNDYGQLGNGTYEASPTPEKILDNVDSVCFSGLSSAAITYDGDLFMWGYNYYGQIGDGTTTDVLSPVKVLSNVTSVSLSSYFSAAITEDGTLYMWGKNNSGQLGDGTTNDSHYPIKIMDNISMVSLGTNHSGAVTLAGELYMWGYNFSGQLGDGTTTDKITPQHILNNVATIEVGGNTSSVITVDGELYVWGNNGYGKAGNGQGEAFINYITYPYHVLSDISEYYISSNHCGAVTTDGVLYMWGSNGNGWLGDGTTNSSFYPIRITDNVKTINLGGATSAIIKNDDALYMCGYNGEGQLGIGDAERSLTFVKVMDDVSAVFALGRRSAALTNDGIVYEWGYNEFGQLGDGTNENKLTPTRIIIPNDKTDNSERKLKSSLSKSSYYKMEGWTYKDFDGDGTNEAFAAFSDEEGFVMEIRFIDSEGNIELMSDKPTAFLQHSATPSVVTVDEKSFICFDTGTGAGVYSQIFGVKNGIPYELKISGHTDYLMQDDDGRVYTYRTYSDIAQDTVYLTYDKETQEFSKPEYCYYLTFPNEDGTYRLSSYNGYAEELVIPEESFEGGTITEIGYYAFTSYGDIKSITIPKTITSIEDETVGYYYNDDGDTLKISDLVIYCYEGSVAEQYAKDNGFTYVLIDNSEELTESELVQKYIDFADNDSYQLANFNKTDIFNKTKEIQSADNEILTYKFLAGLKELVDKADFDDDSVFNAEVTAQMVLTQLLYSQGLSDELKKSSEKAEEKAKNNYLIILLNNFTTTEEQAAKLHKLINSNDKDSEDYKKERDALIEEISDETLSPDTIITVASDVTDFVELGAFADAIDVADLINDIINKSNATWEDIFNFYINSTIYLSCSSELKDALDIICHQTEIAMYENQEWRDLAACSAFYEYLTKIKDTSYSKFTDYYKEKIADFYIDVGSEFGIYAYYYGLERLLKDAAPLLFKILEAARITLVVGIDLWKIFSTVDERAYERDLSLNLHVICNIFSDTFSNYGTSADNFNKYLLENQTEYAVAVYKQGMELYKEVLAMYQEHTIKYYQLLYEYADSISPFSSVRNIAEIALDDPFEKISAAIGSRTEFKKQINVNEQLIYSTYLDIISIECDKANSSPIIRTSKNTFYYIACPVNVKIRKNDNTIAEIINNEIIKYTNDYNVVINVLKEKEDSSSKAIFLPSDYTIEITGYADGIMKLDKITMEDNTVTYFAGIEKIPVSTNMTYDEVIEDEKLVAVKAINESESNVSTIYVIETLTELTWNFDETSGLLTINGTGNMTGWSSVDDVPWHDLSGKITSVSIEEGITSIGERAFTNCSNLTSITIPNSITRIGAFAFYGCTSLTSIVIPDAVTMIEDNTFTDCSSLASVDIPKNVKSIGKQAFYACSNLASVTIPDGVTTIDSCAFWECSSLTSITIPNSVIDIKEESFYGCSALTSVTLSENMQTIESGVFWDCTNLISIIIPESVKNIEYAAFYNCSSLSSITLPKNVTNIGKFAFDRCTSLTSISIPDSVRTIGEFAFYGCSNLKSISIPESVTSIEKNTFTDCSSLTSIKIPNSVKSIGGQAFYGCISLTSVNIPSGVTNIEENTFSNCSSLTSVTLPKSIINIEKQAFYGCSKLSAIVIPTNVKIVGDAAFYKCSSLISVVIPRSVEKIGEWAFGNCDSLIAMTIENSNCEINDNLMSMSITSTIEDVFLEIILSAAPNSNTTIYGQQNSTAQYYAEVHNINFELSKVDDSNIGDILKGDVNGDGKVDASDAADILVESALIGAGNGGEFTPEQNIAADVNGDGKIDASDAALILVYAAEVGAGNDVKIEDFS